MCGGSAIVLCSEPEFHLRVKKNHCATLRGIKESSPAFAFYIENQRLFKNLFIKFTDPHKGGGGFGASSAQFSMLYKLKNQLIGKNCVDIPTFLEEYRKSAGKNQEPKPSGADCLAQLQNNHIYFNSDTNEIENLYWPFEDINFLIFKTGNKLPTHKHLRTLSLDFLLANCSYLTKIVEDVKFAWDQSNSQKFANGIMNFYSALNELSLVTAETQRIVSNILKIDGVVAAKGCGAMLADTVLVIFKKFAQNNIINNIENIKT